MIDRADRCLNKRTISNTLLANYDLSNTRVVFYTVSECKYVYIYVCVVSYSQQQLQSMTTSFFPHLAVMYLWAEIFLEKKLSFFAIVVWNFQSKIFKVFIFRGFYIGKKLSFFTVVV